jgi:hypothetical protein
VHLDFSDRARRFICSVSGHEDAVCIEGRRIFVKCRHCGRSSIGLQLPFGKKLPAVELGTAPACSPTTTLVESVASAAGSAAIVAVPAPATSAH